jgi:hypothetical protein
MHPALGLNGPRRGAERIECLIMAKQRPVDKCKLCGLGKELCDSHYLPKRLYAFLRAAQLQNPNPVMEVGGELQQISIQYRGYVLCEKCEDLFSKHGEKWVLANISHDYDATFPLHDAITEQRATRTPLLSQPSMTEFH